MDKPQKIVKPFVQVVKDLRALAIITPEDAKTLLYMLAVVERPVVDVREEMVEQPRLLVAVGYVFRMVEQKVKEQEDEVQKAFMRYYSSIYKLKYDSKKTPGAKEVVGRFSDKVVMAQALQDPNFVILTDTHTQLKGLAAQIGELRDALRARTRFLEQIANHDRFTVKQEQLEDATQ